MRTLRISWLTVVAAGVAIAVAGCGSDEKRECRSSGGAEFCLVGGGNAYTTTGSGFLPGSEISVSIEGSPRTLPPMPVDAAGRFPGSGGVIHGVTRGEDVQHLRVTGTTSTGDDALFEFVIPVAER